MNRTIFSTITGAAAATLLAITLVSCVSAPVEHQPEKTPTAVVETPTVEPTPAGPAEVGDTLVDGQKLEPGQKAYKMPDGTKIVVSKTEPLPDIVVQDIDRRQAELTKWDGTRDMAINKSTRETLAQGQMLRTYIERETGKRAINISYAYMTCPDWNHQFAPYYSVSHNGSETCRLYSTHGEALAAAEALRASMPVADEWIIIDMSR